MMTLTEKFKRTDSMRAHWWALSDAYLGHMRAAVELMKAFCATFAKPRQSTGNLKTKRSVCGVKCAKQKKRWKLARTFGRAKTAKSAW